MYRTTSDWVGKQLSRISMVDVISPFKDTKAILIQLISVAASWNIYGVNNLSFF